MNGGAEIAAVTSALRSLLAERIAGEPDLADTVFTVQAPDIARADGVTANQLNLFLFRTAINPAWSNSRPPGEGTPLALTLSYLLTAYGRDNDSRQPFSHLILGSAMGTLNDAPLLGPALLDMRSRSGMPGIAEPVRLTPHPLSLDDVSKLWSSFQTPYRLSVAYEATVVLIESTRSRRSPAPVLRRALTVGRLDRGPPLLERVEPPIPVRVGDRITLHGAGFAVADAVRLERHGRVWTLAAEVAGEGTRLSFAVPGKGGPDAGWSDLSVARAAAEGGFASNVLPLAVALRIVTPRPLTASRSGGFLTLEVEPDVRPEQAVALLLGEAEVPAALRAKPASRLQFDLSSQVPGDYLLRLRVDGVVGLDLAAAGDGQSAFDAASRLTVTP